MLTLTPTKIYGHRTSRRAIPGEILAQTKCEVSEPNLQLVTTDSGSDWYPICTSLYAAIESALGRQQQHLANPKTKALTMMTIATPEFPAALYHHNVSLMLHTSFSQLYRLRTAAFFKRGDDVGSTAESAERFEYHLRAMTANTADSLTQVEALTCKFLVLNTWSFSFSRLHSGYQFLLRVPSVYSTEKTPSYYATLHHTPLMKLLVSILPIMECANAPGQAVYCEDGSHDYRSTSITSTEAGISVSKQVFGGGVSMEGGTRGCKEVLIPPVILTRSRQPRRFGSIPGKDTPDFLIWESCRTMPLVGGFSRGSPVSPTPSFRRCSILISITLIGSQSLYIFLRAESTRVSVLSPETKMPKTTMLLLAVVITRATSFREKIYAEARLQYPVCTLAAFIWILAACLLVKTVCNESEPIRIKFLRYCPSVIRGQTDTYSHNCHLGSVRPGCTGLSFGGCPVTSNIPRHLAPGRKELVSILKTAPRYGTPCTHTHTLIHVQRCAHSLCILSNNNTSNRYKHLCHIRLKCLSLAQWHQVWAGLSNPVNCTLARWLGAQWGRVLISFPLFASSKIVSLLSRRSFLPRASFHPARPLPEEGPRDICRRSRNYLYLGLAQWRPLAVVFGTDTSVPRLAVVMTCWRHAAAVRWFVGTLHSLAGHCVVAYRSCGTTHLALIATRDSKLPTQRPAAAKINVLLTPHCTDGGDDQNICETTTQVIISARVDSGINPRIASSRNVAETQRQIAYRLSAVSVDYGKPGPRPLLPPDGHQTDLRLKALWVTSFLPIIRLATRVAVLIYGGRSIDEPAPRVETHSVERSYRCSLACDTNRPISSPKSPPVPSPSLIARGQSSSPSCHFLKSKNTRHGLHHDPAILSFTLSQSYRGAYFFSPPQFIVALVVRA
ncbi:hypothetical protein PR048_001182 [Dryococelus australis]|uniref:Uncharacterized protein n=1 Tax=Dryococelus australis TaxID=614101 RepID=A0ABQ9IGN5_9NEOP|nr:hypothetical protein PR048_001182 [Dryococelus australis]